VAAFLYRAHRAFDFVAVVLRHLGVGAHFLEFGNVGAGSEGLLARAAQHDAAHAVVGFEFAHDLAQAHPHGEAERVELVRVVERDRRDGAVATEENRLC
jgi:hypothetical protein